ncbi:uncharacterized protein LOC143901934 [Temnothorax americanus]|uniref:uncharacterized protein LOC143901934 n=1 Tax=Temnothorax americanus TaxID=1964332 RepID=UPI0040680838
MTRYTVGKRVNDLHNKQVSEVRKTMNSARYVCTTADIWTGSNRRFLGVTAHWIDEKTLDRKSAALACRRFPGTHSFDNIAEMLEGIHTTFGLTCDKIIATVTDNGSNFVKAFQEFGIDDPECFSQESDKSSGENLAQASASANASTSADTENVSNENNKVVMDAAEAAAQNVDNDEFDYECRMTDSESIITSNDEISAIPMLSRYFRCASHTLSLIATTDTINAINECPRIETAHRSAMDRCQDLWKCLNSPKKREELRKFIRCSLKRPVPTRWNYLYDALKQIHSLRGKIMSFEVRSIIQTTKPLRDQDFEYITEYLQWCKPLATAIDVLQGEQYCHYGYLLPSLLSIRKKWELLVQGSNLEICRPLVKNLKNKLEIRFCEYFNIEGKGEFAAIAAFTHPRFKISWMSALKAGAKERVKELAHNIMRPAREEQPVAPQSQDANDDFFDFGENNLDSFLTTAFVPQGQEENELMRYFNETSTSFDLLEKFPLVKNLFIKYNTALPSSAPVERLFSYATLLNLPKFNRLSDSQFEKRVLYKANSKKKYL